MTNQCNGLRAMGECHKKPFTDLKHNSNKLPLLEKLKVVQAVKEYPALM
jgi:hypothetical protein